MMGVIAVIDLKSMEKTGERVFVSPSDNIFQELGNNTYDFKDLISELVDNSIAARRAERLLHI